ncbi:MAG: hypothetical protein ACQEW7_10515 [Pseudomonadota bacterium]
MAQNTAGDSNSKNPGAVLHPGRAADPAPESGEGTADQTSGAVAQPAAAEESPERTTAEAEGGVDQGEPGDQTGDQKSDDAEAEEESAEDIERSLLESKQRKLRLMLRQCDRVLLLDFNLLAMSDWPDNFQMAAARRNRDLWVFSALAAASVFLSGLTGYVPAWLAGGGFGAFVIILLLGVPFVRRLYSATPSYVDLLMKRQRMMRDARKHAEHLEGKDGLVWQCARMADYNPTLRHTRFRQLVQLSEHRMLPAWLTRRDRVRLFLIYLLEAEKAYDRVQHDFFEGNQKAIDEGWESVAAAPQDRA